MMNRHCLPVYAVLIATAALNLHCDSSTSSNTAPPPSANSTAGGTTTPPPPKIADFIFAVNWESLIIQANSAKTEIDSAAHFSTDRNACGKDAFGVLDTALWNTISKDINSILPTTPLDEKVLFCVPYPLTYKMDGTVSVNLGATQKRDLFSNVDGQICSTIRDPAVSNELLDAINKVVIQADKEDCARPPGY